MPAPPYRLDGAPGSGCHNGRMARPSLLIISFSGLRSDARVLKQIRLFTPQYDVTTVGYGEAPEGVVDHVRIPDELVYWRYPRPLVLARRFALAYWRNPVVAYLRGVLPQGAYDVVLADDVDTVPLALSLRARKGVHADLHEYAPRMKEDVTRWRLFVAPLMTWLCARHVTRADSVTTVGRGIAEEYRKVFGIDAQVVTNASPAADLSPTPVHEPIALVHAGQARPDRYLELMIDAVRLATRPFTLDFYLTGEDEAYRATLAERAAGLDGVRIHPAVPYDRLLAVLNDHDAGIYVLPPVNFNNRWALPNKFFDFVQARLALVLSPSPEMAGIIREHGLGVVTEDFTAESLAAALDTLTPESVAGFKAASHAAAHALSAEEQVQVWDLAIAALMAR